MHFYINVFLFTLMFSFHRCKNSYTDVFFTPIHVSEMTLFRTVWNFEIMHGSPWTQKILNLILRRFLYVIFWVMGYFTSIIRRSHVNYTSISHQIYINFQPFGGCNFWPYVNFMSISRQLFFWRQFGVDFT